MSDAMKAIRREKDKARRKADKLEKGKKRLRAQIKTLTEKMENIEAVTRDLVKVKQRARAESEQWLSRQQEYGEQIRTLRQQLEHSAAPKYRASLDTMSR